MYAILKELQNYKQRLLSTTKIDKNTANILNWCFSQLIYFFVTSNQISRHRKLNEPLTSSAYLVY